LLIYLAVKLSKKKDDGGAEKNKNDILFALENSRKAGVEESKNLRVEIENKLSNNAKASEEKLEQIRSSLFAGLTKMMESNEGNLTKVNDTVSEKLTKMMESNEGNLAKINMTVSEKLQETLDKKITESFKSVSENLERVNKGLGEIKTIDSSVKDLSNALSNVKTRGVIGEYQLANILADILGAEGALYVKDFDAGKGTRERVEFATKMPGEGHSPVYLPIDSKFAGVRYDTLRTAYQSEDNLLIDEANKKLAAEIKLEAKTIAEKYINPPITTDFAVLFIPFEGLYAEVLKLGILQDVYNSYGVQILGPTTLGAFLNSLKIGFHSVAVNERAAEIAKTLKEVQSEFGKFGAALEKAHERIQAADKEVEGLINTRTNMMNRKLNKVDALESEQS
jgi:DNA recombination protein RmuC